MPSQYDNSNTGVLFENNRKDKESQPDWKGTIDIDGTKYWVSGWQRDHAKYGTYISFVINDVVTPIPKQQPAKRTLHHHGR